MDVAPAQYIKLLVDTSVLSTLPARASDPGAIAAQSFWNANGIRVSRDMSQANREALFNASCALACRILNRIGLRRGGLATNLTPQKQQAMINMLSETYIPDREGLSLLARHVQSELHENHGFVVRSMLTAPNLVMNNGGGAPANAATVSFFGQGSFYMVSANGANAIVTLPETWASARFIVFPMIRYFDMNDRWHASVAGQLSIDDVVSDTATIYSGTDGTVITWSSLGLGAEVSAASLIFIDYT